MTTAAARMAGSSGIRRGGVVVVVSCLVVAAATAVALLRLPAPGGGAGASSLSRTTTSGSLSTGPSNPGQQPIDLRWLGVLERLDARRTTAWQRGDPRLLRAVYVAGSADLARDQQAMRGYLERGLRVSGVDMHFYAVEVERQQPDRVTLLVIDRLGIAVAQDRAGLSETLPRDRATRHRIELRLTDGSWRIAAVTLG